MSKVGVVIGDEFIPIKDTFMGDDGSIHLPVPTFQALVNKHDLPTTEEERWGDDGTYPHKYRAQLNGAVISAISAELIHFD